MPSYAFVAEPQTNGSSPSWFNRTLKEQIIHGRMLPCNIAELRDAVRDFVELTMPSWIVEKNGYRATLKLVRPAVRRDLNRKGRRVRQTCVQGTGCATYALPAH